MSRRSRSSEESFTLFPFLAVLLCTMGTLTMIFVAIAQKDMDSTQAAESSHSVDFDPNACLGVASEFGQIVDSKTLASALDRNPLADDCEEREFSALDDPEEYEDDAKQDAALAKESNEDEYERAELAVGSMSLDDVLTEQESVEWFLEEMNAIRERTATSMDAQRTRLANAEAALARLRDEFEVAERKYEALRQEKIAEEGETTESLQKKAGALDEQILKLAQENEELREKNKNVKQSYAIVPYQGKKGTFRRPIYVECREDGVYIQPEGIRFDEADFLVARYPGNPFDTALRAVAQHYIATIGTKTRNGDDLEPYPLLIVRPGGSKYFYFAISALASWGDLYGYEFVGEDQPIEFPIPDDELREKVQHRTNVARVRLEKQLREALSAQRAIDRQLAFEAQRANAGGDSFVASFDVGGGYGGVDSELQSRLGSSVRVGAAKTPALNATTNFSDQTRAETNAIVVSDARKGDANASLTAGTGSYRDDSNDYGSWAPNYNGAYAQFMTSQPESFNVDNNSIGINGGDANNGEDDLARVGDVGNAARAGMLDSGDFKSEQGAQDSSYTQSGTRSQYIPNASASGTSTPGYMSNFIEESPSQAGDSSVDMRKTLGNTAYASGANGSSSSGTLAVGASNSQERVQETKKIGPREGIRLSQEAPVTSGIERGLLVRCERNKIVFPKQPGVRQSVTIDCGPRSTPERRESDLLEAFTFCVKSWGAAGRNAYWAPFVKIETTNGGEERSRELADFCRKQGLPVTTVSETNTTEK